MMVQEKLICEVYKSLGNHKVPSLKCYWDVIGTNPFLLHHAYLLMLLHVQVISYLPSKSHYFIFNNRNYTISNI